MNIAILIIGAIGCIAGLLSTFYLVVSLPTVIIWKIYRKLFRHIPLTK